ncbi:MAG: mercury transporter MerT [Rhizobiales bacterium]|nr:mercury transporter MerT [Hyphomicrobiales bacterium]
MTVRDEARALPGTATTPAPRLIGRRLDGAALLSVGGILAALGASACCVVPFALLVAGVSGAWIGTLTALAPYQPLFVGLAVTCLGCGYYAVYLRPKTADCVEGSYCARPSSSRIAKIGLWAAIVLTVIAVGFPYAARLFLDT